MQIANFINNHGNNNDENEDNNTEHITVIDGVTIPQGFFYVGGTKSDGIVISDSYEDENKYKAQTDEGNSQIPGDDLVGNQFVWVPVDKIDEFTRYSDYNTNTVQSLLDYYEPSIEGYCYDEEENEYNLMKASVEINHGFYVARYEAGKENIDGVDTLVSKKNVESWSISWGDSMTSVGTNGAVAKAKGMYTGKDEYNVTSTLIYGVQWDAIMAWIDPNYKTSTCSEDSYIRQNANNSSNIEDKVKNIYDLSGNLSEWTMEAYCSNTTHVRCYRGGNTTSYRSVVPPFMENGFRVALYI